MNKKSSPNSGSLDMLLDTMCNTFGGVCFIALMVAIISAALPLRVSDEENQEPVSEQMIINKETARLIRERDEMKVAIEIQKSFLSSNAMDSVGILSKNQFLAAISSNATEVVKLKKEKLELEDMLAKLTTDISYNSREALRLERLLKELEERLGKPANMKTRAVRTPVERELMGYRVITVWIRKNRMYCLHNEIHVDCKTLSGKRGKEFYFQTREYGGYLMDDDFLHSWEYSQLMDMLTGKTYLRIYCDSSSFARLCDLRDDWILRRKMYNWYCSDEDVLAFVEGYDGKVQ